MLAMKNSEYVLGHSDFELERLARQAQLLEPATRDCFHAAGMAPGMRVLDVGSGTGGRCVLHHQPDPISMLRRLAKHLRPGGTILFLEPDWSFVRSEPPSPGYDRCCRWIIGIFDRAGAAITNTGARMHRAFLAAGLPAPIMRMRMIIGDAVSASEWLRAMSDIAIVMLPTMERHGVATSSDIDCDTIAKQLIQEVASSGSVVIGRADVGAWSQLQSAKTPPP
jgi:hypothetical protein